MFLACDHHSVCVKIALRGDFLQRHGTTALIPNKHTPYPKQARLTRACFFFAFTFIDTFVPSDAALRMQFPRSYGR